MCAGCERPQNSVFQGSVNKAWHNIYAHTQRQQSQPAWWRRDGVCSDSVYAQYAHALQSGNSDILKHALFVSTEDPDAVSYMQHNMTGWQVQYTSVPRNNHNFQAVRLSTLDEA